MKAWRISRPPIRGEAIGKKDLFYYVYGLLHSEDYRTRFADNLSKQLPVFRR
jgi:predicted helicase